MSTVLRRSLLVSPACDAAALDATRRSRADAVLFDAPAEEVALEAHALPGVDLFVRAGRETMEADLESAVRLGAAGVVVRGVEHADELAGIDGILTVCERTAGPLASPVEIVAVVETAAGVWRIRELVRASRRLAQVWLDEPALCRDLGASPARDVDPLLYARGRVISEVIAAQRQPIGELPAPQGTISPRALTARLRKAKNLGYKGVVCRDAATAAIVNAVFTPAKTEVAYAARVREAFLAGVAAGTASVPLDGRMIDVPVARRAEAVLAMAELCAARERAKDEVRTARFA